jgi:hypothetical protein
VGDQHHVELLLQPQVAQDAPEFFAGEGIQRAEGLVEQQHLGLVDQRAADAHALLHAARKLPGKLCLIPAQAHLRQQCAGPLRVFGAACLEVAAVGFDDLQRQQHVVQCRAPGQQRGGLKGHARDLQRPGHRLPVDAHAAP